jgi:hypothetical protein
VLTDLGYQYSKNEIKNYSCKIIENVNISIIPYYLENEIIGNLIVQLSNNKSFKNIVIWEVKTEKEGNSIQHKSLFCSWVVGTMWPPSFVTLF